MADDDFDIDIYGDTAEDMPTSTSTPYTKDAQSDTKIEDYVEQKPQADAQGDAPQDNHNMDDHADHQPDANHANGANHADEKHDENTQPSSDSVDFKLESNHQEDRQQIKSTDESGKGAIHIPKQAPVQQGLKRKEGSDERLIDPGATTAILISDLHWWNTDDDIRGWVNQANCEDELKDITFSEHKVNGKSKGQAYVEFTSQQAATAAKHKIDAFGEGQQYVKRHTVTYSNPNINPFKTLPKDVPVKAGRDGMQGGRGGYQQNGGFNNGGFRGRGGFRGGMNNLGGGFRGGFQGNQMGGMGGGFQPQQQMGGFQQGMGGRGGFNQGGFNNNMGGMNMRGGPNIRGGRGGMNGGMGMGMPMAGMPMGVMGGGMPMGGPMMGGMGNGFPMQPHFNPAFFPQNQGAGDWQNPHGAKRPRPE